MKYTVLINSNLGIRIEDTVIVTDSGPQRMTRGARSRFSFP